MTQSDAMSPDVAKPYAETSNSQNVAKFIEVNSVNAGEKMAINIDRIISIRPSESGGSRITVDGDKIVVKETYESLLAALNQQAN